MKIDSKRKIHIKIATSQSLRETIRTGLTEKSKPSKKKLKQWRNENETHQDKNNKKEMKNVSRTFRESDKTK